MFRFRKKKLSEVIENFKLIFDVGSGWSSVRLSRRTVDAEDRGDTFPSHGRCRGSGNKIFPWWIFDETIPSHGRRRGSGNKIFTWWVFDETFFDVGLRGTCFAGIRWVFFREGNESLDTYRGLTVLYGDPGSDALLLHSEIASPPAELDVHWFALPVDPEVMLSLRDGFLMIFLPFRRHRQLFTPHIFWNWRCHQI